jgi:hypothetical protein
VSRDPQPGLVQPRTSEGEINMKRTLAWTMAVTAVLVMGNMAQAQTQGQAEGQGAGALQASSAGTAVSTEASAAAQADFERTKQDIANKGARVSAEARARAEAKLAAAAKRVEDGVARGEAAAESRMAKEFRLTTSTLATEKAELGASWGQLVIAHTLQANATTSLTTEQLLDLHQEGMGWGQIAAGLGLKLGDVVSAVNTESRVAMGDTQADGRVAVIHGAGARAGLGLGTQVGAGLDAGHAGSVGAGAGVGAGVKIGH